MVKETMKESVFSEIIGTIIVITIVDMKMF